MAKAMMCAELNTSFNYQPIGMIFTAKNILPSYLCTKGWNSLRASKAFSHLLCCGAHAPKVSPALPLQLVVST